MSDEDLDLFLLPERHAVTAEKRGFPCAELRGDALSEATLRRHPPPWVRAAGYSAEEIARDSSNAALVAIRALREIDPAKTPAKAGFHELDRTRTKPARA